MPVLMRHHEALELTRVDFYGKLLAEDVEGYGQFGTANQQWTQFDTMTFVGADTDVTDMTPAYIERFFKAFGDVLRTSDKMVRRRTGWVCDNPVYEAVLNLWLEKRNADCEPGGQVRLFKTTEAACEWLLLTPSAAAALASGEGFTELARFDSAGR